MRMYININFIGMFLFAMLIVLMIFMTPPEYASQEVVSIVKLGIWLSAVLVLAFSLKWGVKSE